MKRALLVATRCQLQADQNLRESKPEVQHILFFSTLPAVDEIAHKQEILKVNVGLYCKHNAQEFLSAT